jgi:DNA-binding CsgD family transcriptional regulator
MPRSSSQKGTSAIQPDRLIERASSAPACVIAFDPQRASHQRLSMLTPMQRQVFRMFCTGKRTDAIAVQLGRSRHTVRNHLKAIFLVFNVRSQSELIAYALRHGLAPRRPRAHRQRGLRAPFLPCMQRAVFNKLYLGVPVSEIARQLRISPFTVRNHIKAIYRAFQVSRRPELMIVATSYGFALTATSRQL